MLQNTGMYLQKENRKSVNKIVSVAIIMRKTILSHKKETGMRAGIFMHVSGFLNTCGCIYAMKS